MLSNAWLVSALLQAPVAPAPALPPATVALVESYSDGRVNYELTSAKPARMWTPMFPRVEDWQPPPGGVAVKALQLARVLVGRDVRVDVSVLGPSITDETPVASVLVSPGAHVIVNELASSTSSRWISR